MSSVLIVGGGISGLSTAYYLNKQDIPFTIIEKANNLGGVIRTETVNNCLIEGGPDSFLTQKPWALDLIRDLGLGSHIMGSNDDDRETFIWKNSQLVPMPDGLQFMIPTKVGPMLSSSLIGWGTKLKMGMEYFRKPASSPPPDRSVSEFVRDHFGQETLDYIAEPLLAGVYGGDPDQLSVASVLPRFVELEAKYGSLTKATVDAIESTSVDPGATKPPLFSTLRNGLGHVVDSILEALADNLDGLRAQAASIEKTGSGFRLKAGEDWIDAEDVVLACEAHSAASITRSAFPQLSAHLAAIPYSSSMTVALGFDIRDIGKIPKGFGFLVPRKERKRVVACTFVGNKFRNREAENILLVRCFLGGASDEAVLSETDETAVQLVLDELKVMAGITTKPLFSRVHRWPKSMAQYTVGHKDRLRGIEECLAALPGLYLAGNAYTGIGVPDCVRMGKEAAAAIAKRRASV
ncbi:MAG: protoporphyrinogen oxidase [Bryobacteraceae bacterium]